MKTRNVVFLLAACLILTAVISWRLLQADEPHVVVYKSPTCGCCVKWVNILEEAGYDVETVDLRDLRGIKQEWGISPTISSCHTAVVNGTYIVEGHVPVAQIQKMLDEQPAIRGLAVPGMPIGSPGMEGPNAKPYDVLAIEEEGTSVYATITP